MLADRIEKCCLASKHVTWCKKERSPDFLNMELEYFRSMSCRWTGLIEPIVHIEKYRDYFMPTSRHQCLMNFFHLRNKFLERIHGRMIEERSVDMIDFPVP